jgi:hypothetical protein
MLFYAWASQLLLEKKNKQEQAKESKDIALGLYA